MTAIPTGSLLKMRLQGEENGDIRANFMNLDHRAIIIYDTNSAKPMPIPTAESLQKILYAGPQDIVFAVLARRAADFHAAYEGYLVTKGEDIETLMRDKDVMPRVILLVPWHVVSSMVV